MFDQRRVGRHGRARSERLTTQPAASQTSAQSRLNRLPAPPARARPGSAPGRRRRRACVLARRNEWDGPPPRRRSESSSRSTSAGRGCRLMMFLTVMFPLLRVAILPRGSRGKVCPDGATRPTRCGLPGVSESVSSGGGPWPSPGESQVGASSGSVSLEDSGRRIPPPCRSRQPIRQQVLQPAAPEVTRGGWRVPPGEVARQKGHRGQVRALARRVSGGPLRRTVRDERARGSAPEPRTPGVQGVRRLPPPEPGSRLSSPRQRHREQRPARHRYLPVLEEPRQVSAQALSRHAARTASVRRETSDTLASATRRLWLRAPPGPGGSHAVGRGRSTQG